jgi:hypothetical protein
MLLDLPFISEEPDRHGNLRVFVRRYGRRIRIRETPGTPEFTKAYNGALDRLAA